MKNTEDPNSEPAPPTEGPEDAHAQTENALTEENKNIPDKSESTADWPYGVPYGTDDETIAKQVQKSVFSVLELKHELENREPKPEELDQLIQAIGTSPRAVNLLFKYANKLNDAQQAYLVKLFIYYADIGKNWMPGFFEEGKLNPNIPEIHDQLIDSEIGLNILLSLCYTTLYFPTEVQLLALERAFLKTGRLGFEQLQKLISRENNPLELLDAVKDEFEAKEVIYGDSDLIFHFINTNPDFKQILATYLTEIDDRTQDLENPIIQVLGRLMERDDYAFILLDENLDELSPDFIQAIVEGNFYEGEDDEDHKVRAYEGKALGRGGMGRVFSTAYSLNEAEKMQYQAIKLPYRHRLENFAYERQHASLTREWDHPHINKPLHITHDFIIYETGHNPRNLLDAFKELTPIESLRMLKQALEGVKEYQRRGYIHGDIKSVNILITDEPEGRKAVLIDNSPVKVTENMFIVDNDGNSLPKWPSTKDFAVSGNYADYIAADTVNRFYGIDNFSLIQLYFYEFVRTVKKYLTSRQINDINLLFLNLLSPRKLSEPDAIDEIMAQLDKVEQMIRAGNPTEES